MARTIEEIATIYGVQIEDVAVRESRSTHLYINQKALCGIFDYNKHSILAGIKMPTSANTFEYGVLCKSCNKKLIAKAGA
jgi:hypothetical protein